MKTRGGQDQFFENEALRGEKWTKKWETRQNLRREMGNETEFETRNGKQDGI